MKKIFGLIVLLVTVVACTVDDDDETLFTENPLLGSWKEMVITSPPDNEPRHLNDCNVIQEALLYTFYDNGDFVIVNACYPEMTEPRSGTYTLANATLTMTEGDAVTTYNATFFSATAMELQRLDGDAVTHIINLEKQE